MTNLDRLRPHTAINDRTGRRSPRADVRTTRRPSAQLVSAGVVATYIHDISERHRSRPHPSSRSLAPTVDDPLALE
jgi:hypothetical protein